MDQDRNKAWGFSLFGDDLRQEAGGKLSLMGLYQDDMIFHGEARFPFLIPKFVIFILYYELRDAIEADINFKVTHGLENNLVAEAAILRKDLPVIQIDRNNRESEDPEDAARIFHARIPIILTPFPVEKPGRLRVRAHYSDGKILKLGSISIKTMTAKEFQELLAKKTQQQLKTN